MTDKEIAQLIEDLLMFYAFCEKHRWGSHRILNVCEALMKAGSDTDKVKKDSTFH
jgi:hypothetical protein